MLSAKGISILLAIALTGSSFSEAAEFKAPALPKLVRKKSSTENLNEKTKTNPHTNSASQEELSFLEQHYASLVATGMAVAASAFVYFMVRGKNIAEQSATPTKAAARRKSTGTPGSGSRIGPREMNRLLKV